MGKHGKKQRYAPKPPRRRTDSCNPEEDDSFNYGYLEEQLSLSSPASSADEEDKREGKKEEEDQNPSLDMPSKFSLYQKSVQSPKGDISYLQKFFMMYVGGRIPLHLQEDFCGTAFLSTEWLRTDARRTAVGLDLDFESLNWCMENNVDKIGSDGYSRLSLFHGNVLQPLEAQLVKFNHQYLVKNIPGEAESSIQLDTDDISDDEPIMRNIQLPAKDIVCAFNYSCCCLHNRKELLLYFKHVIDALSKKGGIFVMDLYGGTSSERPLRLQRKFPNFTYVWEQAEFDIIQRKTRISLHFHLQKHQRKIRHAFSYNWRLWTLPEIKDCMEEAGFQSVHFWIREMPDSEEMRSTVGLSVGRDVKYQEVASFQQQDSWNAYVVGVA